MINRKAIETAIKKMSRDGTRLTDSFTTDSAELMAELCRTNGFACGYIWTKYPEAWRLLASQYCFKEITLGQLRGWSPQTPNEKGRFHSANVARMQQATRAYHSK